MNPGDNDTSAATNTVGECDRGLLDEVQRFELTHNEDFEIASIISYLQLSYDHGRRGSVNELYGWLAQFFRGLDSLFELDLGRIIRCHKYSGNFFSKFWTYFCQFQKTILRTTQLGKEYVTVTDTRKFLILPFSIFVSSRIQVESRKSWCQTVMDLWYWMRFCVR